MPYHYFIPKNPGRKGDHGSAPPPGRRRTRRRIGRRAHRVTVPAGFAGRIDRDAHCLTGLERRYVALDLAAERSGSSCTSRNTTVPGRT
jgi:hypothetical protein